MLRRFGSAITLAYGKLPGHPGKWRAVDWLQSLFGLHSNPWPRTAVVSRAGIRWHLDLRWYVDRTLYFLGEHETENTAWVMSVLEPATVVFDVGANIGWYTLHAARMVGDSGSVHAFEPAPEEAQRLEENVRLNRFGNVVINRCAVDDRVGTVALGQIRDAGATHLAASDGERGELVSSTTLDAYVADKGLRQVDLVKLDVEGVEVRVLSGAKDMLRRCRPLLLVEMNESNLARFGASSRDLLRALSDADYVCCRIRRSELHPVDETLLGERSAVFYNVIGIPRERWNRGSLAPVPTPPENAGVSAGPRL
jgi:FkbM family methyltransferase